MLHAAGALTLDFAEKLLDEGLGLKDASPYNVLFHGPRPVFVDLLSFEPRAAGDPTWLPFAQFVRTFLLPLLVNKHFGISLAQLLTTHRDGLEPEEVFRLLSPAQKLLPPFLTLVSIPSWLSPREGAENPKIYRQRKLSDRAKANFILRRVLQSARRKLAAAAPHPGRTSAWSDYMDKNNYSQDYFPLKQAFVSEVMREQQPRKVLDVGCNTGHFSAIAARAGASVVAIDYDQVVVGEVWRQANAENLDILPFVVNLARPTPSIGWRNAECPSFLDRARGQFDAVLMLGVVHHMLVSERIPLPEIVRLAAELTNNTLVIEFVAPDDPMFRRIARGRDHLFTSLTKEFFEETCARHFDLVRVERLDQTSRWLYLMRKKGASDRMFRDAAISLSLANLCFVKVWGKLLSGAGSYFTDFPIAYTSIIADVLLLACLFFAGITIARRVRIALPMQLARWAFLFSILTVLNGIALLAVTLSGANFPALMGRNLTYFTGLGLTSMLLIAVIKERQRVMRLAPRVILVLLPFVVITFSQAVWKLTRNVGVAYAASQPAIAAPVARRKPATRVLWIIFDEMDQRMSFTQRPASVEMPELDRLRSQSVYAVNAYPPAPLTYMSMPALITGKLVAKVTPVRADELMINFDGEKTAVGWSTQPNIFSDARRLGFNSGLVGWCHPYCEVIGGSLSKCDEVQEKHDDEITVKATMFSQAEVLISTIPLLPQVAIPISQRVGFVNQIISVGERKKYTVRYNRVLDGALKAVVDPDLDLVFIHSPAPHPPGIYDRFKNDFSLESKNGYIDNLELVDRTIGELRRAMERAGVWDETTVIISADHWWRTEMWSRGPFWTGEDAAAAGNGRMDHRIPFVLKLAGQHEQLTYTPGFNTVVTHDLILALMRGEVSSPDSVAVWLDQHRSITDSPYNRDELLP